MTGQGRVLARGYLSPVPWSVLMVTCTAAPEREEPGALVGSGGDSGARVTLTMGHDPLKGKPPLRRFSTSSSTSAAST